MSFALQAKIFRSAIIPTAVFNLIKSVLIDYRYSSIHSKSLLTFPNEDIPSVLRLLFTLD